MSHKASHGGKGDTPRKVNQEKYGNNYDSIFKKHENKHINTCQPKINSSSLAHDKAQKGRHQP